MYKICPGYFYPTYNVTRSKISFDLLLILMYFIPASPVDPHLYNLPFLCFAIKFENHFPRSSLQIIYTSCRSEAKKIVLKVKEFNAKVSLIFAFWFSFKSLFEQPDQMLEIIVIVKKMFRYTNFFLLQPLMLPFLISEHKYGKRYKYSLYLSFNLSKIFGSNLKLITHTETRGIQ